MGGVAGGAYGAGRAFTRPGFAPGAPAARAAPASPARAGGGTGRYGNTGTAGGSMFVGSAAGLEKKTMRRLGKGSFTAPTERPQGPGLGSRIRESFNDTRARYSPSNWLQDRAEDDYVRRVGQLGQSGGGTRPPTASPPPAAPRPTSSFTAAPKAAGKSTAGPSFRAGIGERVNDLRARFSVRNWLTERREEQSIFDREAWQWGASPDEFTAVRNAQRKGIPVPPGPNRRLTQARIDA